MLETESTLGSRVKETSVINYQSTRNIPEERIPHLHHGGSLKSQLDLESCRKNQNIVVYFVFLLCSIRMVGFAI